MPASENDVIVIPPHKAGQGIIHLINTANDKVVLISPFVDFLKWDQLTEAIDKAIKREVQIQLYIQENKNDYYHASVYEAVKMGVDVFTVKRLHAKIYINEKNAIISSLNLLHFSCNNSFEAGFFVISKRVLENIIKHYFDPIQLLAIPFTYEIIYTISIPGIEDYFPDLY